MSIPVVYGYDLVQELGTWTPAASQIDAYDTDDTIAYYEFWDANASGAWIWANGEYQPAQTTVTATSLDSVWFGGATDFTEEALWFRAVDTAGNTSTWDYFLIDQATDDVTAPSLTVADSSESQGTWTPAWWNIYATDIGGIAGYQLWDGYWTGAWIWANGGYQNAQTVIDVVSLDNVWFGGATDAASQTFYVRAYDSSGNWTDWSAFTVNQIETFAAAQEPAGIAENHGTALDVFYT